MEGVFSARFVWELQCFIPYYPLRLSHEGAQTCALKTPLCFSDLSQQDRRDQPGEGE